ncbi:denticleless protein homolog [Zophobas morio]|uniref:denticleless protein homolog n=1 Tax=Zophobas morio TaxID=2755281 RepID=UPI0030828103
MIFVLLRNIVFASAGRDGNICLWDRRDSGTCKDQSKERTFHHPFRIIRNAHRRTLQKSRRARLLREPQQSVTAVTFLKNTFYLASCGAGDGVIKLWDIRKSPFTPFCTFPYTGSALNKGFTSLAVDSEGSQLLASCTDDVIYQYNTINISRKNVKKYTGHKSEGSFYIKSAFSPDGNYIISGAADHSLYIWEVNSCSELPYCILRGHDEEVSCVAWCPQQIGEASFYNNY